MRFKTAIVLALLLTWAKGYTQIKQPVAYLGYASFGTPSGASYFETYITMSGNTLVAAKNEKGEYEYKVNVSVQFSQKDSVKKTDSFNLLGPVQQDTGKKPDFTAVRRYWLPKGEYSLSLKITDKNNPAAKIISTAQTINVGYKSDSVAISDIEFLSSFSPSPLTGLTTKSGYDMVPYIYTSYGGEMKILNFYTEIYNTYKVFPRSKFAVKYYIENSSTHVPLDEFTTVSVHQADTIVPLLGAINIENLRTGIYNLVVAIVDRNNKTVYSRAFNFTRYNPALSMSEMDKTLATIDISGTFVARLRHKDSIKEYISMLSPIANTNEKIFIEGVKDQKDTSLLQRFFYNFWATRNAANPGDEWNKYYNQVQEVDNEFTTINKKGYQSDRGRVYLEYGAPNQIDKSSINPDSYPYEIWEYYKLPDGEVDKKFLFYEPSLATNDYVLLHSTAKGEVQNRQWPQVLFSQNLTPPTNVDQNTLAIPSQTEQDIIDEFNNPR